MQRARTRLLEPNCSYPQTSLPSGLVPGVGKIPALLPLLLGLPVGSPVFGSRTRRDLRPTLRLHPETHKASRRRHTTPYGRHPVGFAIQERSVRSGGDERLDSTSLRPSIFGLRSPTFGLQPAFSLRRSAGESKGRCAGHAVCKPPHGASRVSPFFSRIDSPSSTSTTGETAGHIDARVD